MPRIQYESQSKKVSKKATVNDTSSHHGSGAEEVPSDRTDCVVQNVRSDKQHSGRVDDVVSNTRSENRQKGVIPKTVWGLFLSLQIHSLEVKSQRFKRLTQRLINRNLLRTQFLRNLALCNLSLHNLELHGFLERNKTPKRISLDHLDSLGRGGSRISRGGGTSRRDRTVPSRRGASSDRRHWSISPTAYHRKDLPVGGHLSHFAKEWGKISQGRWVLSVVRRGYKNPVIKKPILSSSPQFFKQAGSLVFRRRGPEAPPKDGSGEHKSGRSRFTPEFSEKERKVKTYNRSVQTEQVPEYSVIQYGNSKQGQEYDLSQRLGDIAGSYGRLSSCTSSRDITEISPILSEGSSVPVEGTSVWPGYKSFCFYSIDVCHSKSQSSSNYSVSIPGRLAGQESLSSRVNQGQGLHSQIDYFTGSNNQSIEIGTNSIPKFYIHRDVICNSRQYC